MMQLIENGTGIVLVDGVTGWTDTSVSTAAGIAAQGEPFDNAAIWDNGIKIYPMTDNERQAAKPLALKEVENEFLTVCQQLTGQLASIGFDPLQTIISGLMTSDQSTAVALSLKLLTIDAAGKREGGLKWWDDCAWHQDIVP